MTKSKENGDEKKQASTETRKIKQLRR